MTKKHKSRRRARRETPGKKRTPMVLQPFNVTINDESDHPYGPELDVKIGEATVMLAEGQVAEAKAKFEALMEQAPACKEIYANLAAAGAAQRRDRRVVLVQDHQHTRQARAAGGVELVDVGGEAGRGGVERVSLSAKLAGPSVVP